MVKNPVTTTTLNEISQQRDHTDESNATLSVKKVEKKLSRSNSSVPSRPSGPMKKIQPQRQHSSDESFVSPKTDSSSGQYLHVKVIGRSHLVQLENQSLIKGKTELEIGEQDSLTIDESKVVISRRGPNQEVFDQIDSRKPSMYNWYPVVTINDKLVSEDWYVREDAFVNEQGLHVVAEPATEQDDKRGRPQARQLFDFPQPPALIGKKLESKEVDNFVSKLGSGTQPIDVKEEIKKFTNILAGTYGGTWMSILYGSYASGNQRVSTDEQPGSDIDVMFSCDNQSHALYREELIPKITECISALHKRVGAVVDDEVPADSKHLISADEMMEAASLHMYYPTNTEGVADKVHIDPLRFFLDKEVSLDGITKSESQRFSPEFLKSKYLRLRLLFNIMTTPNVIHSKNEEAVKILTGKVKQSLLDMSQDLQEQLGDKASSSIEQRIQLLMGQGENKGEYWLGYKQDRKGVEEKLKSLLALDNPRSLGLNG